MNPMHIVMKLPESDPSTEFKRGEDSRGKSEAQSVRENLQVHGRRSALWAK